MSKEFVIAATESTPICEISVDDSSMLLSGVSMPENANEFYFPLLQEIDKLFKNGKRNFTLTVGLSYMNSMSNKQILRLMKHIEGKSFDLKVIWQYSPDDQLMKLKGQELQSICDTISFEINPN